MTQAYPVYTIQEKLSSEMEVIHVTEKGISRLGLFSGAPQLSVVLTTSLEETLKKRERVSLVSASVKQEKKQVIITAQPKATHFDCALVVLASVHATEFSGLPTQTPCTNRDKVVHNVRKCPACGIRMDSLLHPDEGVIYSNLPFLGTVLAQGHLFGKYQTLLLLPSQATVYDKKNDRCLLWTGSVLRYGRLMDQPQW